MNIILKAFVSFLKIGAGEGLTFLRGISEMTFMHAP